VNGTASTAGAQAGAPAAENSTGSTAFGATTRDVAITRAVTATPAQGTLTLLKLGGELLEPGPGLAPIVRSIQALAAAGPLVIVHGAGREIDAETQRRGVPKQSVDGLRITDAATLDAVIAVLAGTVNTRLVAALVAAGVRAVGLTGVDAAIGLSERAPAHQAVDGRLVDLGLVGQPVAGAPPALLADLIGHGYVPAIACLGVDAAGQVLNVNADTLAAALAAGCGARRLIIAGATAGVLDADQATLATLDDAGIDRMIADGSASAGMVAKLRACREALHGGVRDIAIVSGRHPDGFLTAPGTRIIAPAAAGFPSP
jgi:acetylglutamate kinase